MHIFKFNNLPRFSDRVRTNIGTDILQACLKRSGKVSMTVKQYGIPLLKAIVSVAEVLASLPALFNAYRFFSASLFAFITYGALLNPALKLSDKTNSRLLLSKTHKLINQIPQILFRLLEA